MSSFGFEDDNQNNRQNQPVGNNQQIEMQSNNRSNFGNDNNNVQNNNAPNNNVPNNIAPNSNVPNNVNSNQLREEEDKKRAGLAFSELVMKNLKKTKEEEKLKEPQQESEISKEFRNIFQTADQPEQVNNKRRLVMNFSVFYMIACTIILEVLCLYLGVCLGEQIELEYYLSHSIIPLFIILIAINYLTYTAADYVLRTFMKFLFGFLFVYSFIFIAFSIYAFVLASQVKTDNTLFNNRWAELSPNSRLYYFSNDKLNLINAYFTKMIVTGVIYIFTGIVSILNCFFLWDYNDKISDNWIPLLKSRMTDENKKRLIDLKYKLSPNNQDNLMQNIIEERKPLIDAQQNANPVLSNLEHLDNEGINLEHDNNEDDNQPQVHHEHVESNQFNRSETDAKLNRDNIENLNQVHNNVNNINPAESGEKGKRKIARKKKEE